MKAQNKELTKIKRMKNKKVPLKIKYKLSKIWTKLIWKSDRRKKYKISETDADKYL